MENIRDEIIGMRPIYTELGNETQLYLREGEVIDGRGLQAVKRALMHSYEIDQCAQRQHMADRLNRQGILPFYLNKQRVFVPLKMRRAVAARDSVYGYIDLREIGQVQPDGKNACRLYLQDGRQIPILSHEKTVSHIKEKGFSLLESLQDKPDSDPGAQSFIDGNRYVINLLQEINHKIDRLNMLGG